MFRGLAASARTDRAKQRKTAEAQDRKMQTTKDTSKPYDRNKANNRSHEVSVSGLIFSYGAGHAVRLEDFALSSSDRRLGCRGPEY